MDLNLASITSCDAMGKSFYLRLDFITCRKGDAIYSTGFEELSGIIDVR